MKKRTALQRSPSDEQLLFVEGEQMSRRTDQSMENLLMKIGKFIWLSLHFNSNPLKALRKNFPEFEWFESPCDASNPSFCAFEANYVFDDGNGMPFVARKRGARMRYAHMMMPQNEKLIDHLTQQGYTVFYTENP